MINKIAAKLPADAKNLVKQIVKSRQRGRGIPTSEKFMGSGYKDSTPGSMRHDVYRANRLADRLTKNAETRKSNIVMQKVADLLKDRKLLLKITTGTKQSRLKLFAKSPEEARASNHMMDAHGDTEEAVRKGQKVKARFNYTDGTQAFIRGTPGKGVRSRAYSGKKYLSKIAKLILNKVQQDTADAMSTAPAVNEKFFTRMKLRGC